MTFALWSILLCAFLAWLTVLYAKTGKGFSNHSPREYLESLEKGKRQRAYWAQQNTFEILPLYIAAILIGHIQHIEVITLNAIAALFVISRIFYVLAYIFDRPTWRSVIWSIGFGCILAVFLIASF